MCFYACTASVYVQTILVLIMPLCTECECKEGVSEGDVEFSMENQTLAGVITGIRYLAALAGIYFVYIPGWTHSASEKLRRRLSKRTSRAATARRRSQSLTSRPQRRRKRS